MENNNYFVTTLAILKKYDVKQKCRMKKKADYFKKSLLLKQNKQH